VDRTAFMEIATKHFRLGASILMSEKWEEKFEELRLVLDVTKNQNLTLATSRYLEEVAETVKALEDKWLGTASEQQ
jgi:hypothetical protein